MYFIAFNQALDSDMQLLNTLVVLGLFACVLSDSDDVIVVGTTCLYRFSSGCTGFPVYVPVPQCVYRFPDVRTGSPV